MTTQLLGDAPVVGALYPSVPYWPGNLSVKAGTPVAVEEGGAATGKDFALAPGGVIQGKVTWADSGKPAQYFAIRVYTPEGVLAAKDNIWARAATGDGAYTVTGTAARQVLRHDRRGRGTRIRRPGLPRGDVPTRGVPADRRHAR